MDDVAGVRVINNSSPGNFQQNVCALAPGLVRALAVPPTLGLIFWVEAKMDQRIVALAGFHNDVTALAAVAAGRSSARYELLPPKREAAVAAVPGLDSNCGFIDEHGKPAVSHQVIQYLVMPIIGASDKETLAEMKMVWEKYRYISDPHTAVGILGWEAYKKEHSEPAQGLVLATAHAAKFADVVTKAISTAPPLPDRLAAYLKRPKLSVPMSNGYEEFKQFLLAH